MISFQFLNPLLSALSYSLLRFCLLHVQFLTFGTPSDNSPGLFHFCPSFILCFVVVCNNIQPHFYRSFSRPTTSYKIVETSKPSIKTTANQIIQAYQKFPVCTNFWPLWQFCRVTLVDSESFFVYALCNEIHFIDSISQSLKHAHRSSDQANFTTGVPGGKSRHNSEARECNFCSKSASPYQPSPQVHLILVDCPTQLISICIFICCVPWQS